MIRDHFKTFIGTNNRPVWKFVIFQVIVPIGLGAIVWKMGVRLAIAAEIIAGAAVLAGFMFGLVIFVFQLRLSVKPNPERQTSTELPTLIDQLFSNVLYSVVVAFALTVALVIAAGVEPNQDPKLSGVDPVFSGFIVIVSAHLLAVVWVSLVRTRRAYLELRS